MQKIQLLKPQQRLSFMLGTRQTASAKNPSEGQLRVCEDFAKETA